MTRRVGKRELAKLLILGTRFAQVVPDRITRRLVAKGLCDADDDGAFCTVSPNGLRAIADAADAGRIDLRDPDTDTGLGPTIMQAL